MLYWHELDAGFAGRQPLTADVGATDEFDSLIDGSEEL